MNGTAPNQQKTANGALTGIYTSKSKYLHSAVKYSHQATGKSYTTPNDDLGLWATGCSSMTLTETAAHALGLVDENGDYYGKDNAAVPSGCSAPSGFSNVTIADGTTMLQPTWDLSVELPGGLVVAGVRAHVAAQPLIGMGVIGQGDFAVSGAGSGTTFSFRLPAKAAIDFTSSGRGGGKVLLKRPGSSVQPTGTGEIHWYTGSIPEQPLPPLVNGAGWRLQGASTWHTDVGDIETVPAGTYTIEFKPVDGYVTPASVQVTVPAGGRVGLVCPGYYENTQPSTDTGMLTVSWGPLVPPGAGWRLSTESGWREFDTSQELPAGSYTVMFKDVDGYGTATDQTIDIAAGGEYEIAPGYTAGAKNFNGNLVVNLAGLPEGTNAYWYLAGHGGGNLSGQMLTVQQGDYTVRFTSVTGYTTPADIELRLLASDQDHPTVLTATYVQTQQQPAQTNGYTVSGSGDDAIDGPYTLVDGISGWNDSPVFSNGTRYLVYGYNDDDDLTYWYIHTSAFAREFFGDYNIYIKARSDDASAPPTSGWSGGVTVE